MVPLQLDSSGKVKYDLIAKLGHSKDRVSFCHLLSSVYKLYLYSSSYLQSFLFLQVVHTSLQAMLPKEIHSNDPELAKPDDEEIKKVTDKTRQALDQIVSKKVADALPVRAAEKTAPAQYIRLNG